MNIEQLKQQLAEGKITKEQFAAELKKLLDAGTITQEQHDEAAKTDGGNGGGSGSGALTAEQVQAMIAEAVKKAEQSAEDRTRREYSEKLKKEQEEKEKLLKDKMSDEEKAKYEREKLENDLKDREAALTAREVELHTIDKLTDAKLPLSFKSFLVSGSKEDADKNIEAFAAAWQTEIKAAVEAKFKENGGDPPGSKGGGKGGGQKKWSEMTLTERGNLVKEDVELARQLAKEAGAKVNF